MARRSAPGLQVDHRHFQHEDDGRDPADDTTDARPVQQPAEDPGEREAVDRRRDRELERLEPGGRAGDDPRSTRIPTTEATAAAIISTPAAVSGALERHSRRNRAGALFS